MAAVTAEDIMTMTAVRTRPAHRDGEVMAQRIVLAPPRDDVPRAGGEPLVDAPRVGILRRIAAAKLRYCGLEELIDDVMVISSELLTNALVHSGAAEIALVLEIRGGFLHISVIDGMPGRAVRAPAAEDEIAESGRGLHLVEALCTEGGGAWGTSRDGTVTWCRLALPAMEGP